MLRVVARLIRILKISEGCSIFFFSINMDSHINCFTSTAPLPVCLRIDRPQSKTTLNGMIHKFSDNLEHKCNSELKKKNSTYGTVQSPLGKHKDQLFISKIFVFYTLDYL